MAIARACDGAACETGAALTIACSGCCVGCCCTSTPCIRACAATSARSVLQRRHEVRLSGWTSVQVEHAHIYYDGDGGGDSVVGARATTMSHVDKLMALVGTSVVEKMPQ